MKLVFIGNSIVNGFPFSRGKSFPGQIRAAVKDGNARFNADVINKGENGQTTEDLMARFDHDVISHHPAAVFILSGTNDFIFGTSSVEECFANLDEMAKKAEESGITPVLLTPLSVDADLAGRMWMAGAGVDYDRINSEIDELAELIRNCGRLFVDTNIAYRHPAVSGDAHDHAAYVDGVHPTEEGQKHLAKTITNWIETHLNEIGLS